MAVADFDVDEGVGGRTEGGDAGCQMLVSFVVCFLCFESAYSLGGTT